MIPSEHAIAREMESNPGIRRDTAIRRIKDRKRIERLKRSEPGSLIRMFDDLSRRLPKQVDPIEWPDPLAVKVLPVPMTLANQAREEMGEQRWNELQKEWAK